MDCYFHDAVPSVATCRDCARTVCATCRGGDGACPSCRLSARIDAAAGARGRLGGTVGPASPPPGPRPQSEPQAQPQPEAASAGVWDRAPALVREPVEGRALVALGYPFWPLAALALLAPRRSAWMHRQAIQGLAFNLGSGAIWWALWAIVRDVPVFGLTAVPLILFAPAVWLVASAIFAIHAGHGEDVRVPIVSDWLDVHEERESRQTA